MSSLMDGELTRETGLFVIRRLGADAELTATWQRYHLVRDCLRQPGGHLAHAGFASRLSRALDNESTPERGPTSMPGWLKPAASLALTATVAFMAVVLVRPGADATDPTATPGVEAFTAPAGLSVGTASQPASFDPASGAQRARLDAYLMRHNQMTSSPTRQGFVSYIPVVVVAGSEAQDEDAVEAEADSNAATAPDDAVSGNR